MSDKVRQIIRSQWSRRNSRNSLVREEARNLIRVHVQLLRSRSCGDEADVPGPVRTAA
ncbi:MAG: hypothetical protein KDM63_12945 [Verrucomicrobiae bacterium]|nr:hypothetical protein [Verrucomicrobiae bacterium]MCB1087950.1 hypothetical protein [Verrucomicrobiae bacterium]MCB1092850.1 hypothetical protein [Verrucomicrobiae bacterium]